MENSSIQLNHVVFTQNKFQEALFFSTSNCNALGQNKTLIENIVPRAVYGITKNSSIQLNHVAFIHNKLGVVLLISSYSDAIIRNNTLIGNNLQFEGYYVTNNSIIHLINVTFIQNGLERNLLNMVANSSAKLINNRMVGNNFHRVFFAQSSDLKIDTIFIKNNKFFQLIRVVECKVSFELMKIRENNVEYDMMYAENSAGRMANTCIENSDYFSVSVLTTTCTYLRKLNNFPFEITDSEIIWNSEVLASARPIIQLCGHVSLSNMKYRLIRYSKQKYCNIQLKMCHWQKTGSLKLSLLSTFFPHCLLAAQKPL